MRVQAIGCPDSGLLVTEDRPIPLTKDFESNVEGACVRCDEPRTSAGSDPIATNTKSDLSMNRIALWAVWLISALPVVNLAAAAQPEPTRRADVCIYGGTSGGVIAAVTAARLGKKVMLIEPASIWAA